MREPDTKYIDSRDIIRYLEDPKAELECIKENIEEAETDEEVKELEQAHQDILDEYSLWFKIEEELEDEHEWRYGLYLIRDDHFTDYIQDYCGECQLYDPESFIASYIDWDAVARDMQADYDCIEVEGDTYWYRCC